ncbi:MAG: WGR domain-containing protein [Beijerinckiaceae bacterium]|jgi:predicted DNA-binding WGR domain protein|nr:WGR domain-containing protein [Beijerinckiaceae bacterium]
MMQLDMFPTTIRLQCIDPAKNKRRFYMMQVQPTLFGEWELLREWG